MHVLVNATGSGWVGDYAPAPPNASLAARQNKTTAKLEKNGGNGGVDGLQSIDPAAGAVGKPVF